MLALLATLGAISGAVSNFGNGSFLPACTSIDDHGWPRFHSLEELKADSKWHDYFMRVYGMLPNKYPVCVYDFWYIDLPAWEATGLNLTRSVVHLLNDLSILTQKFTT